MPAYHIITSKKPLHHLEIGTRHGPYQVPIEKVEERISHPLGWLFSLLPVSYQGPKRVRYENQVELTQLPFEVSDAILNIRGWVEISRIPPYPVRRGKIETNYQVRQISV